MIRFFFKYTTNFCFDLNIEQLKLAGADKNEKREKKEIKKY